MHLCTCCVCVCVLTKPHCLNDDQQAGLKESEGELAEETEVMFRLFKDTVHGPSPVFPSPSGLTHVTPCHSKLHSYITADLATLTQRAAREKKGKSSEFMSE